MIESYLMKIYGIDYIRWRSDEPNSAGDEDCVESTRPGYGIYWNDLLW